MTEAIIALVLFFALLFVFIKTKSKLQKNIWRTLMVLVWGYPIVYLIYYFNPNNFLPIVCVIGGTVIIAAVSFFWEGGFRVKGKGNDDPSGNSNINKNFTDIM